MPYGFWSKAGLRWRWPRRWDGMPIPLAGGLPSSARAVRRRWPSSSRVVPPAIDGVQQTEMKAVVQEKVNSFFTQLAGRQPEVKQRCRTVLLTRAEGLLGKAHADPRRPTNVDPTLVSV